MAILIHSTVEGDSSEGWFRSAVRVQKVEQLNAALSLAAPHTASDPLPPPHPPSKLRCLTPTGVFWWRGRKHSFLPELAGLLVS